MKLKEECFQFSSIPKEVGEMSIKTLTCITLLKLPQIPMQWMGSQELICKMLQL